MVEASGLPKPGVIVDRLEGPSLSDRVHAINTIRSHEAPFTNEELASLELTMDDFRAALPRFGLPFFCLFFRASGLINI